jgi:hypothetical protein
MVLRTHPLYSIPVSPLFYVELSETCHDNTRLPFQLSWNQSNALLFHLLTSQFRDQAMIFAEFGVYFICCWEYCTILFVSFSQMLMLERRLF